MAAMRFAGDLIRHRLGAVNTLRIGALVAMAGLGAAGMAPGAGWAILGFGIAGIGIANLVPIAFSAAGNLPGLPAGVGLSASQIHRLFPASSGSPMRRLWALRLERARELLDTTRLPHLAEVAWLCGFQSQAHFTHAFKKAHGLTPRAYLAARTACSAHGGSDTQRG